MLTPDGNLCDSLHEEGLWGVWKFQKRKYTQENRFGDACKTPTAESFLGGTSFFPGT